MSRSLWKINTNNEINTNSRRKKLYITDVGKVINVHNGKTNVPLSIQQTMVGNFTGDFVFTKKMGNSIHKEKKKKSKGKK